MAPDKKDSIVQAEAKHWISVRNKCLDAMDERIKSMALGTLVLIWGVFAGEEHKVIVLTPGLRISFLLVAIGAIVVLTLDYVEQVMGYMAAKQRIPKQKVKPWNYRRWGWNAKIAKHVIGCVNLLALLLVLLFGVLRPGATPQPEVHVAYAQSSNPTDQLVGHWCGNDNQGKHYMVLDIDTEPEEKATYSSGYANAESCAITHVAVDVLYLYCGAHIGIYVRRQSEMVRADWEDSNERDPGDADQNAKGTNILQNCER